jgi:hypothetical protein
MSKYNGVIEAAKADSAVKSGLFLAVYRGKVIH